jgi:hypothetical protein
MTGDISYSWKNAFPDGYKTEEVKSLLSRPDYICIGGTDKPVKHWRHT